MISREASENNIGWRTSHKTGFTSVELIIVIAIALLFFVAASPVYSLLFVSSEVNEHSFRIVQSARLSRERAVIRLNNSSHGVYIETNPSLGNRVVVYQGSSYASRDADYDTIIPLPSGLSVSTTIPGNDINFSKEFGVPASTGTILLVPRQGGGGRTITINNFGMAEDR